ncbi:unnamed protein product [Closterium sp. Naga37s-1]|nr:unnamed protein product [Closterium sp. Naga37s-1]
MLTALLLASPPAPSALPAGARAGAGAAVKRQVRVGRVTLTPPRGSEAYPEARGMGVVVARRRACAVGFRAGARVGSALHSPSAPPPHHSSPPHSAFPWGACPWALVDDGLPNHAAVLRPPCCPPTAATSHIHSNARHSLNSTRHMRSHPPPLPRHTPAALACMHASASLAHSALSPARACSCCCPRGSGRGSASRGAGGGSRGAQGGRVEAATAWRRGSIQLLLSALQLALALEVGGLGGVRMGQ